MRRVIYKGEIPHFNKVKQTYMRLKPLMRNQLMRQQELAEYLGTTVQSIVAWGKEGLEPYYRNGTFVLYDPRKVERWLYKERKDKQTQPKRWAKNSRKLFRAEVENAD